jgi:predicted TIM-barrel fold metal-dependent hydrolase
MYHLRVMRHVTKKQLSKMEFKSLASTADGGGEIRDVVGLTQVLFGTDYPYLRRDMAVRCADHMRQTIAVSESERQAVLQGNAQRLFPRLKRALAT